MTVGQSENIEIKVLAFIIATLLSALFLPVLLVGSIAELLLNRVCMPIINAFNRFKLFLLEKYISFTNMPTDGKRKK